MRWIIFKAQLPALLIGTALYVIYWFTVRREWPGISDLIFWIIFAVVMWATWREERMNLEYWIKPGAGGAVRNSLEQNGFNEIYRTDDKVLYKKKQRWTTSYFALVTTEHSLIKLEVAEKFEKKIDQHVTADMLYRQKPVPDRRHWLLRALYTSRKRSP